MTSPGPDGEAAMLALESVHVQYGQAKVLNGVSLTVAPGEAVCLLGANGAGKTTTIRTILGLACPTSGRVTYEGQRLDGLDPHRIARRGIGVVPEGRGIFPRLTVEENLRLGAFGERRRSVLAERAERAFGLFPLLRERQRQIAGTLSGGEQAMLAIGRALMGRPRLLLLDEPSLGLSPLMVDTCFAAVADLHRQGVTILLVEQNAAKALEIGQRGYVLQKGEVIAAGTAEALRRHEAIRQAYLLP